MGDLTANGKLCRVCNLPWIVGCVGWGYCLVKSDEFECISIFCPEHRFDTDFMI